VFRNGISKVIADPNAQLFGTLVGFLRQSYERAGNQTKTDNDDKHLE
jgi:hypothetical protein